MQVSKIFSRPLAGRATGMPWIGRLVEGALLLALLIQLARLIWAVVTPVGPFGDWQARGPAIPPVSARSALFAAFDPFYRGAATATGTQQVTSLPFQLYGIRMNESTGLGSAIIANGDEAQKSFAVGEEIAPGVTLKSVAFDHVVISRGGVDESLFIDQSTAAPVVGADGLTPAMPAGQAGNTPPMSSGPLTGAALINDIAFAPRTENGRVTGIVVSPKGAGGTFAQAGFHAGDIIAQVNGQPIASPGDIASLRDRLQPGARLSLMVERGAATVPVAIILPERP